MKTFSNTQEFPRFASSRKASSRRFSFDGNFARALAVIGLWLAAFVGYSMNDSVEQRALGVARFASPGCKEFRVTGVEVEGKYSYVSVDACGEYEVYGVMN
ncbi:MAG: hypothetical protein GMKNLPBB_02559 [Myxococcota bacterium]|nr:hypothetical protein [Myxococcota bacterium]